MKKYLLLIAMLSSMYATSNAQVIDHTKERPLEATEVLDTVAQRIHVTDIISNSLPSKEKGYYHIYNAGTFIRKATSLEIASAAFSGCSGCLLSLGYANNNKTMKVGGFLLGASALYCAISSIVFHYKSGKELQISAGCIKYSY